MILAAAVFLAKMPEFSIRGYLRSGQYRCFILFLDKMVNTILSCEFFAGRRWREKCMDLRFLRLRRWLLKQQPNKTVFNRFIEN